MRLKLYNVDLEHMNHANQSLQESILLLFLYSSTHESMSSLNTSLSIFKRKGPWKQIKPNMKCEKHFKQPITCYSDHTTAAKKVKWQKEITTVLGTSRCDMMDAERFV